MLLFFCSIQILSAGFFCIFYLDPKKRYESLYFIALLPPEKLREKIKAFKEEFSIKYEAKHALKLPGHISLIPPFKGREEEENLLLSPMGSFAKQQQPFNLELSGFGAFPPRVIFIEVRGKAPVIQLHHELVRLLGKNNIIELKENDGKVHPHITIATRDLNKGDFKMAWPEY